MTGLDRAIFRLALADAKRYLDDGCSPEQATILATPGAWQPYRLRVLYALLNDLIDKDADDAGTPRPPSRESGD